jgi:flagellar hook-length control protein FliK
MADGAGLPEQAPAGQTVSTLSLGGAASRHGGAVTGALANPAVDAETAARALLSKDLKPGKDGMASGPQATGDRALQAPVAQHKPVDAGHGAKALADAAQSGRREATDTASLAAVEAMIKKMASAAEAAECGARDVRSGQAELAASASSQAGQGALGLHSPVSEAGPGSSSTYSASPAYEAGLLTPEAPVTEQMSYWVSRDVQNAQLRLDGFGTDGVEVNITMQGKEAQVDFRTDMPEAREALEGASAQLKDMLSREGLVLSGVSVGTSAQGQAQTTAQQRKDQQAARQARVSAATSASERSALQPLAAPVRSGPGALDLFV